MDAAQHSAIREKRSIKISKSMKTKRRRRARAQSVARKSSRRALYSRPAPQNSAPYSPNALTTHRPPTIRNGHSNI
ncbi:unnamed protein product, partial [Iphiclides podalirius]